MSAAFPTTDPTWELDSIFEGGVGSQSFREEVRELEELASELERELSGLSGSFDDEEVRGEWRRFFQRFFSLAGRISEANSFAYGTAVTHTDQTEAMRMPTTLQDVITARRALKVELLSKFRGLDDEVFASVLRDRRFSDMELWIRELRRDADQSMDPELESLAVEMNRDGLHAWGQLYDQVSSRLKVEIEIDGESKSYSVGQAKNLLESPRRELRKAAYEALQKAWTSIAPVCAATLNAKVGAEQTLYRRRGGDCLTIPLQTNRVERETVEAIFEAARHFRPLLVRYLNAKAKLLGEEKLAWYDRYAPLGEGESSSIPYEEAQAFIVEQVRSFSPAIADFCEMALSRQWVEVEDRPGKAQGGYCTSLPITKQFRIFMTYGGTNSGVTTLAHELGHGYHFWVMRDLSMAEMEIPMGLAESASTLLEALVEQAALREAEESEKLALLDERLGRAVAFLMDIPARYEVEKALHEHRATGTLHEDLLREITREKYEESFGGGVAFVDDLFWASKLHFFITEMPFYNFPYSFGYLFSRAIYDRAIQEGESFVEKIDDLLRDTGRLTSEEVARKYLDGDLRESSFWKAAAGTLQEDVERFEALVNERVENRTEGKQ